MAKKTQAKKTEDKEQEKKQKAEPKQNVKKHLDKKVTIGSLIGVAVLLIILFFPTKYEAVETYIDINEYTEEYDVKELDMNNPKEREVCIEVPADMREEPDPFSPFVKAIGKEHVCYAKVRVWNTGKTAGKWTYKYIFNINGKDFEADPVQMEIPALSSYHFEFMIDECNLGDRVTGYYVLLEGPMARECQYETYYDEVTVTKTRIVTEETEKQRRVTMTRPLWKKILGIE